MTAVSSDSFVAVTELPQAVVWDDQKNMVNLVLLVCVGKNSSKAFQMWNYLAKVFSDKHFVERLLPDPSYEHFIALLKEAIAGSFQEINRRSLHDSKRGISQNTEKKGWLD